jgi:hypothetical protein
MAEAAQGRRLGLECLSAGVRGSESRYCGTVSDGG